MLEVQLGSLLQYVHLICASAEPNTSGEYPEELFCRTNTNKKYPSAKPLFDQEYS